MRAQIIHVTDHALKRWRERGSKTGCFPVRDIIEVVRESRIVKKTELLPFGLPRYENTVYAYNESFMKGGVLFILESISIDEYRLVTVIANSNSSGTLTGVPKRPVKERINFKDLGCILDVPDFDSAATERKWLIEEQLRIEQEMAGLSKSDPRRKALVEMLNGITAMIVQNKSKLNKAIVNHQIEQFDKFKSEKPHNEVVVDLLTEILSEIKQLRAFLITDQETPEIDLKDAIIIEDEPSQSESQEIVQNGIEPSPTEEVLVNGHNGHNGHSNDQIETQPEISTKPRFILPEFLTLRKKKLNVE